MEIFFVDIMPPFTMNFLLLHYVVHACRSEPTQAESNIFRDVLHYKCGACMQVVNGQNLPKPGGAKEIIDPYVVIELFGAHEDKKVFKTKVVNDNGMYVCVCRAQNNSRCLDIKLMYSKHAGIRMSGKPYFEPWCVKNYGQ